MAKRINVSVPAVSLLAEREELVGAVAAARQRINDALLAGENTAAERTEISRLTARIAEIDAARLSQIDRVHGDNAVAVDREMQRLVSDAAGALAELRGVLSVKFIAV